MRHGRVATRAPELTPEVGEVVVQPTSSFWRLKFSKEVEAKISMVLGAIVVVGVVVSVAQMRLISSDMFDITQDLKLSGLLAAGNKDQGDLEQVTFADYLERDPRRR